MTAKAQDVEAAPTPSFRSALATWTRVALLSFGGPAAQIAVMHRILVDEKKWIGERRFLHALNFCMLLPGPEAQQLATYIGWVLHGAKGGAAAGLLFIAPGFLAILALSVVYATWREGPLLDAVFFGLKPAVLAVVVQAVLRIGGRILHTRALIALAVGAFVALFAFNVPFPAVILAAAAAGWIGAQFAPGRFLAPRAHGAPESTADERADGGRPPTPLRSLLVAALFLALWFAPLGALAWAFGSDSVFVQQHLFFSKTAMVTFGGAYSVLAYVAQRAVETYHWLAPGEMLDGLGMAETTPGPLIMVVQFVGFLGAYRSPGPLSPTAAGVLGAVVTTWVTFTPCFLWIFLGAPYVERLRKNDRLAGALAAITAAVVGVIANLALWFAIHVMFSSVASWSAGPLHLPVPDYRSLDVGALVIAAAAALLIFRFRRGIFETMLACTALGVAIKFAA